MNQPYGSRQVDTVGHRLAAVPFEVDQYRAIPLGPAATPPGSHGDGQGRQQHVVDPRVERRRHRREQAAVKSTGSFMLR